MGIEPIGTAGTNSPDALNSAALTNESATDGAADECENARIRAAESAPERFPDVAEIAAAWPTLPEPIRLAVLALIRMTGPSMNKLARQNPWQEAEDGGKSEAARGVPDLG